MDLESALFCILLRQINAEPHNIPSTDLKEEGLLNGDSVVWEAGTCTPPGVLLMYLLGLYLMSGLVSIYSTHFVEDLMACELGFYRYTVAVNQLL
jgi:hypothetical protein